MNALHLRPPARDLIHDAIDAHGPVRVLLRASLALLRPRARPPDVASLTPAMRRDIGLGELPRSETDAKLRSHMLLVAGSPRMTLPGDMLR